MIGIEEVAERNNVTLFKTSRPGQWKAHCPACGDRGRSFHLYVSSIKDTFFCHKCGERGGVVAFHAWLKGLDFDTAKAELYPPVKSHLKRPMHPAEMLTRSQLLELGFTTPKPKAKPPAGADPREWRKHRRAELDWIWSEWCEYEKAKREYEKQRQESDERIYREICKGMGIDPDLPQNESTPVTQPMVAETPIVAPVQRIDLVSRRRVHAG